MTEPSEAMWTEKRSGPRTEPWGTPVARCCDLDSSPLQDTLKEQLQCRAVRYDDIYRMDEIKSISFHIMFYRLYRGVAKYTVSGNTFS